MKWLKMTSLSMIFAFGYVQQVYANNNEAQFLQIEEAMERGDYAKVFKLLKPIADQDDPSALFLIGTMYETGMGVTQSNKKANECYEKAANNGSSEAQFNMGKQAVENNMDFSTAAKWYLKSAEKNYAPAQYQIGILYSFGLGVDQDYKQAFKWLKEAAIQNYPHAQYQVGAAYTLGNGVKEDERQALYWFDKACANNIQDACKASNLIRNGTK